jgi:hypothetical protein
MWAQKNLCLRPFEIIKLAPPERPELADSSILLVDHTPFSLIGLLKYQSNAALS